jgi:hypothetical protein
MRISRIPKLIWAYVAAVLMLVFSVATTVAAATDNSMAIEKKLTDSKAGFFRHYCADTKNKDHQKACVGVLVDIDTAYEMKSVNSTDYCVWPDNSTDTKFVAAIAWIVRHPELDNQSMDDAEQAMLRGLWGCPKLKR